MNNTFRSWLEEGSVEIIVLVLLASLIVVLALPLLSDLGADPAPVLINSNSSDITK